jgi:DNA-directed RNA polymerase subunit L
VTYHRDTKILNAATFEIQREDHTVGEPLVTKLHEDEGVTFAACKVPHPLEHRLMVKVRTASAEYTPLAAYNAAVVRLSDQLQFLKDTFKQHVAEACAGDPSLDFDPASKFAQPEKQVDEYGEDMGPDEEMMFDESGYGAAM